MFAEELRAGDLSTVVVDTQAQMAAGADVLDVNAGIPLVDEAELLAKMLQLVQEHTDAPICIDSSVIEALEAGLAVYEGKPLVNSVTGEDDRLEEILPLVAKHGAAVIGLANDETGIPETPQQRLEIATKIVSRCGDYGIPPEDVVIDPLAMTVGADTEAVTTTLETIRLIRDDLGVNMCLGASNVSFGLPRPPRAQRRVPADGDGRRPDERDHEHGAGRRRRASAPPTCCSATTRGARAGSPSTGARQGRGGRGGHVSPREPQLLEDARARRRERARPAAVRARRRGGPRAQRHAGVRRRELERHRDRLDVRRARHVQEVQGPRARGRRADLARSTRARSRPTSCATAGGWRAARPRAGTS